MVHTLVLMNIDVGGSFSAPPFRVRFAAREPLLAVQSTVALCRATVLTAEFASLFDMSWDFHLSRDFVRFSAAIGFGSTLFAAPRLLRVLGLTFATLAAVIRRLVAGHIRIEFRLNFRQLLHQFLGVCWHNVVQTIILIFNLHCDVVHQQATCFKRKHRNIPLFDFGWALWLILEAWKRWCQFVKLLQTVVKGLDW